MNTARRVQERSAVFEIVAPLVIAAAAFSISAMAGGVLAVLFAWFGASFCWLAVAYGAGWPAALGKRSDGTIHWASLVLLAPLHLANRASLALASRGTHPSAEVVPGLHLGGLPVANTEDRFDAVLDVTAEFCVAPDARTRNYRCLPILDRRPPSGAQLREALQFIEGHLSAHRRVLVHCALGNGRSAAVVVAYLCSAGLETSVESALARVRQKRPSAKPTSRQLAAASLFVAGSVTTK